jgi:hypothetical protein
MTKVFKFPVLFDVILFSNCKIKLKTNLFFQGDVWPDALPKKFHFLKKSQQQSHAHDRNFLHAEITQCGS